MSSPRPGPHLAELLSAYLDDELAPAARREAESHLEGCRGCRDELELVSEARASVRSLPVRPCPPEVWAGLLALPGWPERGPGRRAAWAVAAAAAAVVALLLPREPGVTPVLPSLVESHAARASISGDPLSQLAPIAVPVGFGR